MIQFSAALCAAFFCWHWNCYFCDELIVVFFPANTTDNRLCSSMRTRHPTEQLHNPFRVLSHCEFTPACSHCTVLSSLSNLGNATSSATPTPPSWVRSLFAKQQASAVETGDNTNRIAAAGDGVDPSGAKQPKPARPPRPPRADAADSAQTPAGTHDTLRELRCVHVCARSHSSYVSLLSCDVALLLTRCAITCHAVSTLVP